jgi:hypothetical protein
MTRMPAMTSGLAHLSGVRVRHDRAADPRVSASLSYVPEDKPRLR